MNCSNCNVVNFNSGRVKETQEIMCENGHFLCLKCYASSKTKCIKCGGRLFDNENIPMRQHNANWTLDMIIDWSKMNDKPTRYSNYSYDEELDMLRVGASTNLLFSRSRSFDGDSDDNSNSVNILNLKWNQACENADPNSEEKNIQNGYFEGQNSHHVEYSDQKEDKSILARKDTRQNLVDQMTDEIRGKIQEEIYNLFKNESRSLMKPGECMSVKQCKTIGVSTESEPNLLAKVHSNKGSNEHIVEVIDLNLNKYVEAPQECLTMNVETTHNSSPKVLQNTNGKKSPSIGTVPKSGTQTSTITEDKLFYNKANKLEQIISSIYNTDDSTNSDEASIQWQSDLGPEKTKDFVLISNSSRASYSPPIRHQIATIPSPQFQPIANTKKPFALIVDASTLHIPRSPVICPIRSCRQACFVSDFTRHITVDHANVPLERIFPRQCKNFFLDPKLIHIGSNRCQMLLLIKDKITNLGHEKFKDFIPVLVMSTKVSSFELGSSKSEYQNVQKKNTIGGFFMIWLTGLMPSEVPIFFNLTVWARSGNMPSCHIVHSGQLYSVRDSQNATTIQDSGHRLLLSQNQVDLLTNNGRNMLELQIVIN